MKVGPSDNVHLCYCSNIHAGESWAEVRDNLETYTAAVKAQACPDRDFGIGLRLSNRAARELHSGSALEEFREFLARSGMYVFTINAFPYGVFHGQEVKEKVYLPDWRMRERLEYADLAADILAELLPDSLRYGSLSTVPGAFGERARAASQQDEIAALLTEHIVHLSRLADQTGRVLMCALEPEPACFLETVPQTIAFLEDRVFSSDNANRFAAAAGGTREQAEERLRRHIGVCLDTCHTAVEFEQPEATIKALHDADIGIGKLQISAGLWVRELSEATRQALREFEDNIYLHQVVENDNGRLRRFDDLSYALADTLADAEAPADSLADAPEWRVHFHVPVFLESLGRFESTQSHLSDFLALQRRDPFTDHLEIETYTWNVLPDAYRGDDIVEAIVREIEWTRGRLQP